MMKLDLKSPHQTYRNAAGKKVPGMTTVLGVYSKEALMSWYGTEEREGVLQFMGDGSWTADALRGALPLTESGRPLLFATVKRDKAADLGTIGHAHVEARLMGTTLDPDGLDPKQYEAAKIPAQRFFDWTAKHMLVCLESEKQMVSERWQLGGTADSLWRCTDGSLELWDIKTGKPWYEGRPYDEQIAQASGYAEMYEEVTGERVSRVRIARTGKTAGDDGDLYLVSDEQRTLGVALVEHAVAVYNIKWKLKQ